MQMVTFALDEQEGAEGDPCLRSKLVEWTRFARVAWVPIPTALQEELNVFPAQTSQKRLSGTLMVSPALSTGSNRRTSPLRMPWTSITWMRSPTRMS